MKIFEAMLFKRQIRSSCSLDVKMLDTVKDGIVLTIEKNSVNSENFPLMTDFVTQHKLSLLLDSGSYFISTNILAPSAKSVWESY